MSAYNLTERLLARLLDNFPAAKQKIKTTYQWLNYLLYRESRRFQQDTHPQAQLLTPEQWAQVEPVPGQLFFGYYDKTPWSQDNQQLLLHQLLPGQKQLHLICFHRPQQQWHQLGSSPAWNYQQGTMAQWLPDAGGQQLIIYNTVAQNQLSACITSSQGQIQNIIPWPVQTVHPGGQTALTLNYRRLALLRPEYGYAAPATNFKDQPPLNQDGIWQADLNTGQGQLMITLAQLSAQQPTPSMDQAQHKVNHIIYSPTGENFVFMHRWLGPRGKFSRLYCAPHHGRHRPRLLLDHRMVSHYHWYDDQHLLVYGRTPEEGDRYYLIDVTTGQRRTLAANILDTHGDGHPSYAPNRQWLITDTYPDRARLQRLILLRLKDQQITTLGRFLSPLAYSGPQRCDLHPRWSPNGNWISFDSVYTGERKSYLLDISELVQKNSHTDKPCQE